MHMDLIWGCPFLGGGALLWLGLVFSLFPLYALPLSRRSSSLVLFIVPQKEPLPQLIGGTWKRRGLVGEIERPGKIEKGLGKAEEERWPGHRPRLHGAVSRPIPIQPFRRRSRAACKRVKQSSRGTKWESPLFRQGAGFMVCPGPPWPPATRLAGLARAGTLPV